MHAMGRPSLLILSFSRVVDDARVLKQVTLFARDYDVTTCCYGPAPEGTTGHVRIPDELVYWAYPRPLVAARRFAAAYRHNPVVDHLWSVLPRGTFDVVLADDVDTVPLALELAPRGGVHADLHEYAPRMKEDLTRWRLFVAPLMRWLCREHVSRCASVTTVGEGIAKEYAKRFGFTPRVVTNAAPYAELAPGPTADPIRLVHSGAARADRHLDLMVDAVELAQRPLSLDFFLTPNDPAYLERLTARVADLPSVTVHPPVAYAELSRTLNGFDVGVYILPPVNFNNAWALPNKFFDFVQARLGVVLGPSPEMAALVRKHGLGTVSEDFTAESFARALDALTPEAVDGYKAASHAVARELSADAQVRVWAEAVAAIAGRVSASGPTRP
jgi:hypothetical protein